MSDDKTRCNRRSVLKKAGAATVALSIGATGSAVAQAETQDTKDHYIRFEGTGGEGTYDATLPDENPDTSSFEDNEGDDITVRDGYCVVDGVVRTNFKPYYDEYRFNGSLDSSNFTWGADNNVKVIINGDVKQYG